MAKKGKPIQSETGEYATFYKLHETVNGFKILGFMLPNGEFTLSPTPESGFDYYSMPQYRVKCPHCSTIFSVGQMNLPVLQSCGCLTSGTHNRKKNFNWEAKSKKI